MISNGMRVTVPAIPADLAGRVDLRDEDLRLAQFRYSRTVMAGSRCDWRLIEDTPIHETEQ